MHPLGELTLHVPLEDRGVVAIACHVKVAIAEDVVAVPEYAGVKKLVLAE